MNTRRNAIKSILAVCACSLTPYQFVLAATGDTFDEMLKKMLEDAQSDPALLEGARIIREGPREQYASHFA